MTGAADAAAAVFARLDRAAAPGAIVRVEMSRGDAEEFRFTAHALAPDVEVPPRGELMPLVPPGSRWFPAVGWDACFGFPLAAAGRRYWALGAEVVCARAASTGGAYPLVRAYLHAGPTPPEAALARLAAALDPDPREPHPLAPRERLIARALPGRSVDDTRPEQASIVRQALAACREGRAPLFRTAVLAEAELAPLVAWPMRLPPGVDQVMVGVPEALARGFGLRTQLALDLRRLWSPG